MPDSAPPFAAISRLAFAYAARPVFDAFDLTLPGGRQIALLGPNGSGKSTLFSLLAGLHRPQGGTLEVLGSDAIHQAAAVRRRLGIAFQKPCLDAQLTGAENLAQHGRLYGLNGTELRRRCQEIAARFDLERELHRRAGTLSGGWQRRVDLARCLLHQPEALLLDEPTVGLDPAARRDFWRHVDEVHRTDSCSILFTTHWCDEAARADLVVMLDRGRLVAFGSPAELTASLGGRLLVLRTLDPACIVERLEVEFDLAPVTFGNEVRAHLSDKRATDGLLGRLTDALASDCESVATSLPSLEDVFFERTGRSIDA